MNSQTGGIGTVRTLLFATRCSTFVTESWLIFSGPSTGNHIGNKPSGSFSFGFRERKNGHHVIRDSHFPIVFAPRALKPGPVHRNDLCIGAAAQMRRHHVSCPATILVRRSEEHTSELQ